jgi:hypothetical protein
VNELSIVPTGLSGGKAPIVAEVDGVVVGADVGDLDVDGYPEIYVFTQSAGSGSYGSVIAYAANKKKSLSPVTLPDLSDDQGLAAGYTGHDEFAVVEDRLMRRFKLSGAGDTNAVPGAVTRQIQYRLEAGEAGWILRVDNVSQF